MRVLVACEFSGIVRDAFRLAGHSAYSCDLLPTESPTTDTLGLPAHIQTDIRGLLNFEWDLVIAHPPCTRLTNAGVRWLHERNLWDAMREGAAFFNLFKGCAPRVCIENPIMHKYARELCGPWTQTIQPWQFGEPQSKRTCLWLENLPKLVPTNIVEGREQRVWLMGPSPERAKERSRFFPGIAKAMAEQWGSL